MIRSSFPRAIIENRRPFFFFSFQVQGGKKKIIFFKESRTQSLQEGDGKMSFFFFLQFFKVTG
ncbi:Uncharacterized protein APZ42_002095 [Daphnia magna]|uniref:Uncharacterized protein n=1 Tax=Daphnia magna TaxID=35525 RepID=A0A162CZC4_9CRUS|nr:Uncharacterized protein APZ42_002095 [Daphnia magna]